MPSPNDPKDKDRPATKKASAIRRRTQKEPVRRHERRLREVGKGRSEDSLPPPGKGLDPRQAITEWLNFAKEEDDSYVTGKRSFSSNLDRVETVIREEKSLFRFCRAKNIGFAEAIGKLVDGPPTRYGTEHEVFYHLEGDPPRVTKTTKSGKYGRIEHTPFLYLERLDLSNFLFPVLDVRFEDCVVANENEYSIISSMRAFSGPAPKFREIDAFLRSRGFVPFTGPSLTLDYTNRDVGLHLRDCHPGNWVKGEGNILVPIDIIPERIV